MAEFSAERLHLAEQLCRGLATENRLTPPQARAFVRGLQASWRVPAIEWRESESEEQFADVRRLFHAAEILREIEGQDSLLAKDCYRRAAEILEWLSRANDSLKTIAPIELLAAAAFQLGGLSAMASGLIGQIDAPDAGTTLYSKFLAADFNGVIAEVTSFWQANLHLTERDASTQLLTGEEADGVQWYFTVELVRCIGLIAASLRQGNDKRLLLGLQKLKALDQMATRSYSDDVSMLVSLMSAVAERYQATSIYGPLLRLSSAKPAQLPRLVAFGRGQFGRGRGILWSSQILGLERLLGRSSFALCTPTGSGKTLVANLALIKELLLAPDEVPIPLALYLVPSRALAGEVETKLMNELGRDLIITGLYGGSDWGITDYWLNADRPTVLIATVEKADALMRNVGPLLATRLRLLIVDEAHQVVTEDSIRSRTDFSDHSSRSLRLEAFVSRLMARLPNIARIALTAVAGGAASPVAKWIEGDTDAEPIGTSYRSMRQLVGTFAASPERAGKMALDMMNGSMLHVRGRGEPVYIPLNAPAMPQLPATMRNSVYRFNELNLLWTAIHLLEGKRRVLISVAQRPEQTMKWFKEALNLPGWAEALQFEPPTEQSARRRFDQARASCLDYCGDDSYEVALLDCGIATSHGQMPLRLRRLMTALIEHRICPITVATATLTEGVNLPFDLIFIPSLKRVSFDQNARRSVTVPMSTAEFRNLAGRAGRPGATLAMEGITLVAIPALPSTTAAAQLTLQRNQIREMRGDYNRLLVALSADKQASAAVASPIALLLQSIAERASTLLGIRSGSLLGWLENAAPVGISGDAGMGMTSESARFADSLDELDGILLTAIEELAMVDTVDATPAELEARLVRIWQRSFSYVAAAQEAWMERAFVRRGRCLVENIYPDPDERKRLFQYGFSPYVGRRFEAIAPRIRTVLENAFNYGILAIEERLEFFVQLTALLTADRGFGLRARDTVTDSALLADWRKPLAWWLQGTNAQPPIPEQLRAWQRFVSENFEFRLGVAIGAVAAQAWTAGAEEAAVPSLGEWRATSGLPWFAFWAKELLRWGTLDPFVAFVLAQGLAGTRSEATRRRPEFEAWMRREYVGMEAEDWIDPQRFLEWARSIGAQPNIRADVSRIEARLTGSNGSQGAYSVLPVYSPTTTHWIDPSGFELATSPATRTANYHKHVDDFELSRQDGIWVVRRTYHLR
jgi:hypothetical protein